MKTKLQQLREAIIKEIPEIVELKFGCKIEFQNKIWSVVSELNEVFKIVKDLSIFKSITREMICFDRTIKIIGRPITLADVLRVLDDREDGKIFSIKNTEWGGEFIYTTEDGDIESSRYWNLTKNDLNDQSKETIDFLVKIILKEDE